MQNRIYLLENIATPPQPSTPPFWNFKLSSVREKEGACNKEHKKIS